MVIDQADGIQQNHFKQLKILRFFELITPPPERCARISFE